MIYPCNQKMASSLWMGFSIPGLLPGCHMKAKAWDWDMWLYDNAIDKEEPRRTDRYVLESFVSTQHREAATTTTG